MKNQFDPNYNKIRESTIQFLLDNDISLVKTAKQLQLDRGTITKWARDAGIDILPCGAKKINETIFNNIDTEQKAYWLGFMYADGWVMDTNSVGLGLKKSDINHLYKYKSFLSYEGNLYEGKNSASLQFRNKKISVDLQRLGCIPRKSLKLTFPTTNQVPVELVNHFIRGYFDGDGSITDPKKCSFGCTILGTYDFLTELCNVIELPKTYNINKTKNIHSVQLAGDNARKVLSFMYDESTIYLDRKMKRYKEHIIKYSNRQNYL